MNENRALWFSQDFHLTRKTGVDCRRISCIQLEEVVMALSSVRQCSAALALAASMIVANLVSIDAALAAQGPGTGAGTAGSLTQLAMAVVVYGMSALVVAAGLIGAVRGR